MLQESPAVQNTGGYCVFSISCEGDFDDGIESQYVTCMEGASNLMGGVLTGLAMLYLM